MTAIPPPFVPPAPAPAPVAPQVPPPWWVHPPRRSFLGRFFRTLFVLLFVLSVLINVYVFMAISALGTEMSSTAIEKGPRDKIVAVYSVNGVIGSKAAANFYRFYQAVRDKPEIKAVVVRVESPGGGVSASDQIHQMVRSIREKLHKPVVVSMGGLAASGGYYISAPADEIYAEPTTVTGSIGVLAAWPVFKGLMDKWGIEAVIIRSTHAEEWKAKENFMETPTPAVRKDVQNMLDVMQERFEQVVRDGRGSRLAKPKAPAPEAAATRPAQADPFNGRVYVADEAKTLGLVDQIGYLHDAGLAAAKRAKVEASYRLVEYAPRTGVLEALLGGEEVSSRGEGAVRIDAEGLENLTAPRILMIWKP